MSMIFNDFVNQVTYSYVKVSNVIRNALSATFVPPQIKKSEFNKGTPQTAGQNFCPWELPNG